MKFSENINTPQGPEKRETEFYSEVPTIDIIRHGETDYKELKDSAFVFNPEAPGFALDVEHLDLSPQGIESIRKTAEQLASKINKDEEVVLFISSPQYRALSSALICEKIFTEHGIKILNSNSQNEFGEEIKTSSQGLGQIPMDETLKSEGFGKTWIEAHKKYIEEHPEVVAKMPAEVHALVAASLGKELLDIFSASHQDVASDFKTYLRHLININYYLQPETRRQLKGKKLRIVLITHEERVVDVAKESLGLDKTIGKGQLLEMRPNGQIEKDGETRAEVVLYGKDGGSDLLAEVKLQFSNGDLFFTMIE